MATARIVFICLDPEGENVRARVLRSAGYDVAECRSLAELVTQLRSEPNADLVCVAEGINNPADGALALARSLSSGRIVLFRTSVHHYIHPSWDLQVEPLTHPRAWLEEIATLLRRGAHAAVEAGDETKTAARGSDGRRGSGVSRSTPRGQPTGCR